MLKCVLPYCAMSKVLLLGRLYGEHTMCTLTARVSNHHDSIAKCYTVAALSAAVNASVQPRHCKEGQATCRWQCACALELTTRRHNACKRGVHTFTHHPVTYIASWRDISCPLLLFLAHQFYQGFPPLDGCDVRSGAVHP